MASGAGPFVPCRRLRQNLAPVRREAPQAKSQVVDSIALRFQKPGQSLSFAPPIGKATILFGNQFPKNEHSTEGARGIYEKKTR
jgi:hypothetical protein